MATARSARSFMRRTARGSATPKQKQYLASLLARRDTAAHPLEAARRHLAELDADRASWDDCSLAGMEDFITWALECPERSVTR